jgi:4'-phosphopantetheinyl transferase
MPVPPHSPPLPEGHSDVRAPAHWSPGPRRPRLARGEAHVWLADLDALGDTPDELLTEAELTRARRMRSVRERRRWTRAHTMLRDLLGRYLGRDPRAIALALGDHGKPRLADDAPARASPRVDRAPAATLRFNLSHSGPLAVCAFSATDEIGVDLELARRPRDEVALAARTFGHAEARRLESLGPAARARAFLALWARHEAAVKCTGAGLGAALCAHRAGAGLWITELDVGERGAAALALERAPGTLRCLLWTPDASD